MNLLTVTINLKTSWLVFTARLRPQFAVLFESSRIFFKYTGDRCKKWTRILNCDFGVFEIFKKALCGPSVADLGHYGRGQTRSQ